MSELPILVTGAAGKTGLAVLGALAARGAAARAFVRRPEQEAAVRAAGAAEVVAGDLRSTRALDRACAGAGSLYHICPNMHPDEAAIGGAVIAAAGRAGLERFVHHSVLHPETRSMPHHWRKLEVEERLLESGLEATVLRPAAYFQNLRAGWERVVTTGVFAMPYAPATRVALVDLEDVAEAAARVLLEAGHGGATYELASGEAPSQEEIAAELGRALGRPVRAVALDRGDWEQRARESGVAASARADLLAMFRFYERHGLPGNGRVLGWLLGRPPTGLPAYLRRTAASNAG